MTSGKSNKGSRKYGAGAHHTPKKLRFFGGGERNAAKKEKKEKSYNVIPAGTSTSNKLLIAALAGASAGIIAGILMAPDSGRGTLGKVKRRLLSLGDNLDATFRKVTDKLEDKGITRPGDSLQIQGNWDKVKGKLKTQYGDLTDQDLAYLEGHEDTFLGHLETKLGKSKQELIRFINSLV